MYLASWRENEMKNASISISGNNENRKYQWRNNG